MEDKSNHGAINPNSLAADIRALIVPVYLPILLLNFGAGSALPVMPLYTQQLGAGLGLTGLVVALKAIGALCMEIPAGRLVSKYGERRIMLLGALAICVAALLAGAIHFLPLLALTMFVKGAAQALWFISVQKYIREQLPQNRRGRALSLIGGATRIGLLLGPIAGGVLAQKLGLHTVFYLQAVVMMLNFLLILFGRLKTSPIKSSGFSSHFFDHLKNHWQPIALTGIVMMAVTMIRNGRQILFPLWGNHIGLDIAAIGLVMGLGRSLELFLVYPAGMIMDRLGRKWAAVPCLVLMSLSVALIPLTRGFSGLLLVALLGGLGNGFGSGLMLTMGSDLAPDKSTGEVLGLIRMIQDIGATAGPLLIGVLAQTLALAVSPLAVAGLGLVGAWVLIFRVSETLKKGRSKNRDR